jgi:hypothetical protein
LSKGERKMSDSVTYILFVQDHSGSMNSKSDLAIENFNEQRAKLLKEDDETMDNIVSIVEFDDEIQCNVDGEPIAEIPKMDKWWTGGMTALYDAIGFGINLMKRKLDNDPRKDKAVLVVVQTDGAENASSDYEGEEGRLKIKKMIDELEETKIWSFTFLGENIDEQTAMSMGFKAGNIMNHRSDRGAVAQAYHMSSEGLDTYMKSRKRGDTQTMSFYTNDNSSEDNNINDNNSK